MTIRRLVSRPTDQSIERSINQSDDVKNNRATTVGAVLAVAAVATDGIRSTTTVMTVAVVAAV